MFGAKQPPNSRKRHFSPRRYIKSRKRESVRKGAQVMRRISSRVSSFPALVVLLGAVLLAATFLSAPGHMSAATPRPASTPAVQITPNSGPYGTETVVTGQGFAPHEQVAIYKETRPFFAYNT